MNSLKESNHESHFVMNQNLLVTLFVCWQCAVQEKLVHCSFISDHHFSPVVMKPTCLLYVMWLKSSSVSIHRYNSVAPRSWTDTFFSELRELPPLSGKSTLLLPSLWHWALFNGHCVSRWLAPGGQGVVLHRHSWLTNVRSGTGRGPRGPNNAHPLGRVSCHLSSLVRGGWRLARVCEGGVVRDWLGYVMGVGCWQLLSSTTAAGFQGWLGNWATTGDQFTETHTFLPTSYIHTMKCVDKYLL